MMVSKQFYQSFPIHFLEKVHKHLLLDHHFLSLSVLIPSGFPRQMDNEQNSEGKAEPIFSFGTRLANVTCGTQFSRR